MKQTNKLMLAAGAPLQRLSGEVRRLEARLETECSEKELLSAELETLFQRLQNPAASTGGGLAEARCVRDIITLKKKVGRHSM